MLIINLVNKIASNNPIYFGTNRSNKCKKAIATIKSFILTLFKQISEKNSRIHTHRNPADIGVKKGSPSPHHPQLQMDESSSIIYNPKTGEYIYITKAPPITNLVISGGGAKGVILPGVIKAFEDHKTNGISLRDQLENVAGSSIGAISAAFIALGISADDIINATAALDFKGLLGTGWGPFNKNGTPLMKFIRENIKKSLSDYLKQICHVNDLADIQNVKAIVDQLLRQREGEYNSQKAAQIAETIEKALEEIKKKDVNKICITFSMLQSFRELDPKVFKGLTVTATCRENGKTFYFDADKTPHLDIALV
jgi:predicted acylesterase/phospholipase RssA